MKKALCALFLSLSFVGFSAETYDSLIIGGGPGAVTAALYMARAGVYPLVVEGALPGGMITKSELVENWPGEKAIRGTDLSNKLRKSAEENGAVFIQEEVVGVDFSQRPYKVVTKKIGSLKKNELYANSIIIAMGSSPNYLGVEGESKYWGRGVTNCAVCDGALYRGKKVAVVGGGDSALLEANYLSSIAKEVHIFVRKDRFKTVETIRQEDLLSKKNVHVHYNSVVEKVLGDEKGLTALLIKNPKESYKLPIDGLFLAIGSTPNTGIFKGALDLTKTGHIATEDGFKCSKEGIYAVGDISDPIYKQAISAAGDGAKAAIEAQHFLMNLPHRGIVAHKEMELDLTCKEVASREEFFSLVEKSSLPVIVDFYAPWCGPCHSLSPVFDRAASEHSSEYLFVKVNIDQFPALAKEYQVRSIPTMISFEKGKVVERKTGSANISSYLEKLQEPL